MDKKDYSYKISEDGEKISMFIQVRTKTLRESYDINDIMSDCVYRISNYLP